MYIALKNHFNKSDYDYFKYNGKTNVYNKTFQTNKHRWHYERIAKKYRSDSFNFILSNLVENPKFWVSQAFDKKNSEIYSEWMRFMESDGYCFKSDIHTIREYCDEFDADFNDLFVRTTSAHPEIYLLYKKGHIHYCTLCYFAHVTNFHNHTLEEIPWDPVWKMECKKIDKTYPFIEYRTKGFHNIVVEIME